jgi:hypothetical protein
VRPHQDFLEVVVESEDTEHLHLVNVHES